MGEKRSRRTQVHKPDRHIMTAFERKHDKSSGDCWAGMDLSERFKQKVGGPPPPPSSSSSSCSNNNNKTSYNTHAIDNDSFRNVDLSERFRQKEGEEDYAKSKQNDSARYKVVNLVYGADSSARDGTR